MSDSSDDLEPPSEPNQTLLYELLAGGAVALVALGTVLFHWLEDWGWVDSFYYCVIAATTVGFGDVTPQTSAGKLLTVAYVIAGISLFTTYLDARFRRAAARHAARDPQRRRTRRRRR